MYITFFGLRELPFPLANGSHFFYATPATQKAEESIVEALRKRTGMVLLTGEPGTGKTMLLRRIVSSVDSHASVIVLPFSAVTFDDILTYLCEQFSIVTSSDDPFARVLALQEHIQASAEQGKSVILCIDEAQNLRKETLDRLHLLLHLKGPSGKLLQIFLVGQQPLETKLAHPDLRHIQQYIAVHHHLGPLSPDAVKSFILHRLCIAGCERADLFTPEAIERIAYYSQRIPRSINIICDNALIEAYLSSSRTVSRDIIEDVAQNLQLDDDGAADETAGPPVNAWAFQEIPETLQSSGRRWLYNIVWTAVGVAFAWLSSGPQLPSYLHFNVNAFSTESTAQLVTNPPIASAGVSLSPPPSRHENKAHMTPGRTEHSSPVTGFSAPPTDSPPISPVPEKDKVLLARHQQGKETSKQDLLAIRKYPTPETPKPTTSTATPPGPTFTEEQEHRRRFHSVQVTTLPNLPPATRAQTVFVRLSTPPTATALMSAVVANNIQQVRNLVDAHAPVNGKDKRGWTALMVAARDNRPTLVRLLLAHGAEVNARNTEGETALIHAADHNHPGIVQLLLDHGAAINTKSDLGWTALMYAASKGHRLTVETLLSEGANAKVKDRDGRTASMYAARQGNLSTFEERLGNRPTLRNRFAQFFYERLQPSKRHDYKVIASLLKEAETKQ